MTSSSAQSSTAGLRQLSTPRAAALAGVVFALLFGAVLILIRTKMPEAAGGATGWLTGQRGQLGIAVELMPFAGISFLWFMAVVRDGFGRYEDRFFATVFLGSGLLFLAMMFVAAAVAAGLIASITRDVGGIAHSDVAEFGKAVVLAASKTYGLRMAAVFMISLATIWTRTGLMPRWLVVLSYLAALALLIISDLSMWITPAFPAWVLVVSALLLAQSGLIADWHAANSEPPKIDNHQQPHGPGQAPENFASEKKKVN